jgi:DNA polymerase-3 subunit gamma/tau
MAVLRDLAEITHWISVIKITPEAAEDPTVSPDERARGLSMAEKLPMRAMTRMWQMLLKALEEVAMAPNAMMAAEMAIIRLTHISTLPSPEDLVRKLQDTPPPPMPSGPGGGAGAPMGGGGMTHAPAMHSAPSGGGGGAPMAALAQDTVASLAHYPTFDKVVELIRAHRDVKLLVEVETTLRLVSYSPGRIEFEPTADAPRDLAARLAQCLQTWTGTRWGVSVTGSGGGTTIAEDRDAERLAMEAKAQEHPLVQAVLLAFPSAKITDIRTPEELAKAAAAEALPEVDDEWDPFEDS